MSLTIAVIIACVSFMAAGFIIGIMTGGRCEECWLRQLREDERKARLELEEDERNNR